MKRILFVCTGNTCRSCMAEGIFNSIVGNDNGFVDEFTALSAGIAAFDGSWASENAVRALREEWGIDISSHHAKSLNERLVDSADVILTMTREHKHAVSLAFPKAKNKVYTLKEYVMETRADKDTESYNYALDILDPYGMNLQAYKKCAREIKDSVDKLIKKLESI